MRTLVMLAWLTSFSAHARTHNYIVGGQDVAAPDPIAALTVGIFTPSPEGHNGSLCTGTLIRRDMVVTAAHCLVPGGPKPVVIFGRDLHSAAAVQRRSVAVAVHSKWRTQRGQGMDQGDIALVKFPGGLPPGYQKASLARVRLRDGDPVTLAGYGINNARTKTGAGILRQANVRVAHARANKSEMILDQSHGRGACHGDSGGPAFLRRAGRVVLAGVTNRGYPNRAPDDCRHQVVYTKIPAYRSWIREREKHLDARTAHPVLLKKKVRSPHRGHARHVRKTRRSRAVRAAKKGRHSPKRRTRQL